MEKPTTVVDMVDDEIEVIGLVKAIHRRLIKAWVGWSARARARLIFSG